MNQMQHNGGTTVKDISIILVDDDLQYLKLLVGIVEENGFKNHHATSGEHALEILRVNRCELMITDLQMPGMNGYELSMLARKLDPDMEIVLFTGAASAEVSRAAAGVGISRVVAKPCSVEEILAIINDSVGGNPG